MTGGRKGEERKNRAVLPLAAGLLLLAAARSEPGPADFQETPPSPNSSGRVVEQWAGQYGISAHLFLFGSLGEVGTMTIESAARANGGQLEKTLRMAGQASPEQVKKNRDFRGEFNVLKLFPLRTDGTVDQEAVGEWRNTAISSSGFLKLNKKFQSERIAFFPDHAVSMRDSGIERRVEGGFGSILSPLEFLAEHDIKVGDIIDLPFILNGVPRVFRSEVTGLVTLTAYRSRAYQIDVWAYDQNRAEEKPSKDIWRKKGNVRVWFCKDGPYRNQMLKMKIKFRWYLWLYFDLKK
jgi:hypothetical protein